MYKYWLYFCIYLSRKNNASPEETTPNPDQNTPRGILKNNPDENTAQTVEDAKRKKGLLFDNSNTDLSTNFHRI